TLRHLLLSSLSTPSRLPISTLFPYTTLFRSKLAPPKTPEDASAKGAARDKSAVVFEDFGKPSFEGWHVNGLAFAAGPIGGMANSFRGGSEKLMGTLTSKSFRPSKQYIHVRLAGTKFSPVREH